MTGEQGKTTGPVQETFLKGVGPMDPLITAREPSALSTLPEEQECSETNLGKSESPDSSGTPSPPSSLELSGLGCLQERAEFLVSQGQELESCQDSPREDSGLGMEILEAGKTKHSWTGGLPAASQFPDRSLLENWLSNLGAAESKWEEESEGGGSYTSPPFSSTPHMRRDFVLLRAETGPGMRASPKILALDMPEGKSSLGLPDHSPEEGGCQGETNVLMAGSGSLGTRGSLEGGGWSQVRKLGNKARVLLGRLGSLKGDWDIISSAWPPEKPAHWKVEWFGKEDHPRVLRRGAGREGNGLLRFLDFPNRDLDLGQ